MRATAFLVVAASAAAAVACLAGPWWAPLALTLAALPLLRPGYTVFASMTLAINAALFGFLRGGWPAVEWPPWPSDVVADGAVAGLRIVGLVGANLALFRLVPPGRFVDDLELPAGATARVAAVVLAAHDVGETARKTMRAHRLAPRASLWRRATRLLPHLWVGGLRAARTRAEALRLAGHAAPSGFVAFVAVAGLAVAGRLAFIAIPNVALTFVAVFLGGLVFGWRVGAAAGAASMAVTNLMLTGLAPLPFANVPAMAVVGAGGGLFHRIDFTARDGSATAARLAAGLVGALALLGFSILSDVATWLAVPELRSEPGALRALLLLGLAFNVVPAAVNAILFAAAVGPIQRVSRALDLPGLAHRSTRTQP